ncbi:protein of unknown function [Taphrina deformans PYCC 5710]|uniref:Delta(24)-sterol reductase n=1 Tax=Taphrina deformans (strain PYCC 5710 / ATCC 11124 / CBS 356.35 / IMI 108563 / JCM 9778 / NBRC 8474) TaxID=1097556 RepID=R4XFU2_TAPDE|nr:protein of unknown function [Taphrina deformans PYCC 5710]|eukprot:CCG84538.1 protein of unknown function [Taphrina deformans PYCC 5710]
MSLTYKFRLVASILYELSVALVKLPGLLFSGWPLLKSTTVHEKEIAEVARQVKEAYVNKKQIVLHRKPGHGHSARSSEYKRGHYGVDVAKLDSILVIEAENQTVTVQAGVSFETLCAATLEYGLLPVVVPEFKRITVGGAIQGIGIESSSWKNGAVDEGVIEATLILGDGTIVSSEEVPDLWSHVPGSNGSLALVVAATLRLRAASKFIRVQYRLFDGLPDFLEVLEKNVCQFTRSMVLGMFAGCIATRDEGDSCGPLYQEDAFSPFFFQHIEEIVHRKLSSQDIKKVTNREYAEHMPTMQYLFRYDRGGFWGIMALGHMLSPLKFVLDRPLLTGVLNHFLTTSTLYKVAMLLSDLERESAGMLQDVDVPASKADLVVQWAMEHHIDYLWLCPVKNGSSSIFSVSGAQEWVLNIGLYGVVDGLPDANKALQRLVADCGGKTALYAHIYVTAEEFWTWYDRPTYDALRQDYHGAAFLDLFKKVGGISSQIT